MAVKGPRDLELAVLGCLRNGAAVRDALNRGLAEESFSVEEHQAAFRRLVEADPLPSPADISALIGLELPDDNEDLAGLVDELVRRSTARRAREMLAQYLPALDLHPQETLIKLALELPRLGLATSKHVAMADRDAQERLELVRSYKEKAERGETVGILTGLPTFDDPGYTWREGELIAILGVSNVGKSALMMRFCVTAYVNGHRILYVSPESTKNDVELRMDPMLGRELGFELSNLALRTGRNIDMEQYESYVERLKERSDWITADSGTHGQFTAADVVALVKQYNPTILAIDGFHLLRGEGKNWETIKDAADVLKGLTQEHGLVTFASCQGGGGGREAYKLVDTTPELYHVSYGAAIMEAADRVVSLGQRRGDEKLRFFRVVKFRNGPKMTHRTYLKFDVDAGIIEEDVQPETEEEW